MIKNVILSTLAIAVLAGCSGKKDSDKDTSVVEAIPVKVQKLEKENIARTLDYTANLQADEQVYYAPAATGRNASSSFGIFTSTVKVLEAGSIVG